MGVRVFSLLIITQNKSLEEFLLTVTMTLISVALEILMSKVEMLQLGNTVMLF